MRKFLIFLLISLCFFCSCYNNYDVTFEDSDEIPFVENTTGKKYIVSVKGNTYHLESCYVVKNMNQENIRVFYNKQYLEDMGNSPCKRCNP